MTTSASAGLSKTYKRGGGLSARRPRQVGAALIALAALILPLSLTGCGGGGGGSKSSNSVSRAKKGNATFTVVWPERTRLVPQAANSIVVTLTRVPDADIATAVAPKSMTLTRPLPAPTDPSNIAKGAVSEATFTGIETGTYMVVATSYPGTNGPGTGPLADGTNVPLSTNRTANNQIVVVADTTVSDTFTLDTTISQLVPGLPAGFVQTPANTRADAVSATAVSRLRPGQTLQLSASAFDATPATATPAGPYRVFLTPSKVNFTSSVTSVATVDPTTGLVTAQPVTAEGTTVITVTDSESGKSGTLSVTVTPVGLSLTAPWPKFHATLQNNGTPTAANITGTLTATATANSFPTGSTFQFASPVVDGNDTVYIGTYSTATASPNNQKLYALTSASTNPKWTFPAGGDIDTAPVIGRDGTIFFGTTNGLLYALRDGGTSAKVLWTVNLNTLAGRNAPITASPTLDRNGVLYVAAGSQGSGNYYLYALDSLTGARILATDTTAGITRNWEFQTTDYITNSPTLSTNQDRIYVADNSANVYAIETGIPSVATPGILYGDRALQFVKSSLDVGATTGSQEGVSASPVYVQDIGGRTALFIATTGSNRLLALDPIGLAQLSKAGSQEPWIIDAGGAIFGTPAISPDGKLLYYATQDFSSGIYDHKVAAVNTADGSPVWRTTTRDLDTQIGGFNAGFNASPALSGDGTQLYIADFDGNIYGFDATRPAAEPEETREPLFALPTAQTNGINHILGSPGLRKDGTVVVGGTDGRAYFVK